MARTALINNAGHVHYGETRTIKMQILDGDDVVILQMHLECKDGMDFLLHFEDTEMKWLRDWLNAN